MNKESRECTKKVNNKGFSLVEVLVAVIILALVAGPILMALVMSARFNARARDNQRINTVAESVMEEFKGFGINPPSGYSKYLNPGTGVFSFATERRVDDTDYDVKIIATPIRDREAANLNGADTSKDSVVSTTAMNAYYDYVYTMDMYQDKIYYDRILNEVYNYVDGVADISTKDPDKTASDLWKYVKVNRYLLLDINGDESAQRVTGQFIYTYEVNNCPVTGHAAVSHNAFTPMYVDIPDNGNVYKELKSVYVFYSPGYSNDAAKKVAKINGDTIAISNHISSRHIEAYVVKQTNPLYGMDLYTLDASYNPTIDAHGDLGLHKFIKDTDSIEDFNSHTGDSLMYSIKIEVYSDGAKEAGFSGTPLYTLDGSVNSKENDG